MENALLALSVLLLRYPPHYRAKTAHLVNQHLDLVLDRRPGVPVPPAKRRRQAGRQREGEGQLVASGVEHAGSMQQGHGDLGVWARVGVGEASGACDAARQVPRCNKELSGAGL